MNEPALRRHLQAHPPEQIASMAARAPARSTPGLAAHEVAHPLACECGSVVFRLLGVPAAMASGAPQQGRTPGLAPSQRGYVLRSMLRLWRELRMTLEGEAGTGLIAPIMLDCARCSRRHVLASDASSPDGDSNAPLEAWRCRPCRRSSFEATAVFDYENLEFDVEPRAGDAERFVGWRLNVCCRACRRTADPVVVELRDAQQRVLDSLYGRSGVTHEKPTRPDERGGR